MRDYQDDGILITIIITIGIPLSSIYCRRGALMGMPYRGTLLTTARNPCVTAHVVHQVVVAFFMASASGWRAARDRH